MSTDQKALVDEIAIACANHMASEPDLLVQFMNETGVTPDALRDGMTDAIKSGLFGFFAHNEPALLAMCSNANIAPEQFMRVYYKVHLVD